MRYNPDDRQFIFNTEKHMDVSTVTTQLAEKHQRLREEQRLRVQQQLREGKVLREETEKQHNQPDTEENPTWFNILAGIVFLGFLFGSIILGLTDHSEVGVSLFGGLFVIFGFSTMLKKLTNREERNVKNFVIALMIILIGLSFAVPMLLTDKLGSDRALTILYCGSFVTCGLYVLVSASFDIYSAGGRNCIPVEGRCICYAHMIEFQKYSYIKSSEVFEYDYAGEHYESVNEVFRCEPDAEIGETVTLRLNPHIPSEVFYSASRKGRNSSHFISAVIGAAVLAVGIFLGVLALNGTFENDVPDQNTNANGKYVLSDAVIEEKIGDSETPWDISLYNIAEKYEKDGVYYLRFSNDPLISTDKEKWDKFELNDAYYIVRNTDTGKLIAVLNSKEWDYQGSHPLLDMRE